MARTDQKTKMMKIQTIGLIVSLFVKVVLAQDALLQMPKTIIDHKLIHDNFYFERGYKEVEIIKARTGHYLIPVWIKGSKFMFLLDTGANGSGIRGTIADSLKLKKIKNAYTVGFTVDDSGFKNYLCTADSIKIGDVLIDSLILFADNNAFRKAIIKTNELKKNNQSLVMTPEQVQITSGTGLDYDGVIGDDLLSRFDAIINLYAKKLYLRKL
jgi:hypothetical protein